MTADSEPAVLLSIDGVRSFLLQDGNESELTASPTGHTLSMVLVPTEVTMPAPSPTGYGLYGTTGPIVEVDYYLHLRMPGLDLSLPATTPIYSMPPRSYIIPFSSDLEGVFHKFEFLPRVPADLIETFESIMSQFTAFSLPPEPSVDEKSVLKEKDRLARQDAAKGDDSKSGPPPPYNPAEYQPGEGYVRGTGGGLGVGRLVLVDEENGSVVGELSDSNVVEDSKLQPGSKTPVEITIDSANRIKVAPMSEEYLSMARHPVYSKSSIVQTSAMASRFIVMASDQISKLMANGADGYIQRTRATENPLTFKPATHDSVRRIGNITTSAATLSAKTAGQASKMAQNIGATFGNRDKGKGKKPIKTKDGPDGGNLDPNNPTGTGTGKVGYDGDGNPIVYDDTYKPGMLNKSLIAFSTVMDGLAYGGTRVLKTGADSVTQMVTKKWGDEAGTIANGLVGGVKNVGLVYIDVTGVSRRAMIKSVAKGMIIGRVKNGGEIVVRGTDAAGDPILGPSQSGTTSAPALTRQTSIAAVAAPVARTASNPVSRPTTPVPPPPPYPAPTKS